MAESRAPDNGSRRVSRVTPKLRPVYVRQRKRNECGIAALAAVLIAVGNRTSYDRLRTLCDVQAGGASVDQLENVARTVGMPLLQIMVPPPFVVSREMRLLPAIALVRKRSRNHFIVVWRSWGSLVQVTDPAVGCYWVSASRLLSSLLIMESDVDASEWRSWALSKEVRCAVGPLLARRGLGDRTAALLAWAEDDPTWRAAGRLHALSTTAVWDRRAWSMWPSEALGLRRTGSSDWTVCQSERPDRVCIRGRCTPDLACT